MALFGKFVTGVESTVAFLWNQKTRGKGKYPGDNVSGETFRAQ